MIRGLDLPTIKQGGPPAVELQAGDFKSLLENQPAEVPEVALGNELAKNIGASIGTHIKIISPLGTLTPMGRMPRIKNFQVGAIFHSGMFEFDNTLVYASIPRVQDYLGLDDKVTGLEVQVKDIYAADAIAAEIQKKLGPAYQTRDWMRMNRSLFAALKLEKIAMFIILTLIVLVAAFNITSTLIMLVMEKTKDIAILKSMGATRRSIMRIFMLEGVIIGAIGTVIGLALGFLLTSILQRYEFIKLPSDVYYISTLPVKIEPMDVAVIAGATMLISFLATLYPSWQASRLEPVEAIRFRIRTRARRRGSQTRPHPANFCPAGTQQQSAISPLPGGRGYKAEGLNKPPAHKTNQPLLPFPMLGKPEDRVKERSTPSA